MVMTAKTKKEQKNLPINRKEDNPARKHMSHADALKDNARLKAERDKLAEFKTKLRNERLAEEEKDAENRPAPVGTQPKTDTDDNDNTTQIMNLEAELAAIKPAPGSKDKKAAIQKQIDILKIK